MHVPLVWEGPRGEAVAARKRDRQGAGGSHGSQKRIGYQPRSRLADLGRNVHNIYKIMDAVAAAE